MDAAQIICIRAQIHGHAERHMEWIAIYLGTRVSALPFQLSRTEDVLWRGTAAYRKRVETERLKVAGAYQAMPNRRRSASLLSKLQAAGKKPSIRVLVFDHRRKKLADLPEIQGVEVKLIQSGGGVFEVVRDGKLLFSKKKLDRFPEHSEILDSLQAG